MMVDIYVGERRDQIKLAMEREPDLTASGFICERDERYRRRRNVMLTEKYVEQFDRAYWWLNHQCRNKHINVGAGNSDFLKNAAIRFFKKLNAPDPYISNGMMIAPAIVLQFQYRRTWWASPSIFLNISKNLDLGELRYG